MSRDKRIYIAAPFFNDKQVKVVKAIEQELFRNKKTIYFSPRNEGILKDMTPEGRDKRMKFIFDRNVEHIGWCDFVVAVIDDYDTGTVWEMGLAFGIGKKIITYCANYHGINVMLNESIVSHCNSIHEITSAINGEFTGVKPEDVT